MQYFIFQNDKVEEVEEYYYNVWYELFAGEFDMEDYALSYGSIAHTINTCFDGAQEEIYKNTPMPFKLVYNKDKVYLNKKGIRTEFIEGYIPRFATYDELLTERRNCIRSLDEHCNIHYRNFYTEQKWIME